MKGVEIKKEKSIETKWYKELMHRLCLKDTNFRKENKGIKDDFQIDWSITASNLTFKQYAKQWNTFHTTIKNRIIYPVLIVLERFFKDKLTTPDKIGKEKHNHIFHVVNDTFEETLKEMLYLQNELVKLHSNTISQAVSEEQLTKEYKNGRGPRLYRLAKDFIITIAYKDTYYRTMFEMFIINLAYNIMKKYPKGVSHLFYTSKRINDKNFMYITQNKEENIVIENENEILVVPKNNAIIIKKHITSKMKKG